MVLIGLRIETGPTGREIVDCKRLQKMEGMSMALPGETVGKGRTSIVCGDGCDEVLTLDVQMSAGQALMLNGSGMIIDTAPKKHIVGSYTETRGVRNMKKLIEAMVNHTDCNPWYWLSYGEKCYAFACVVAITLKHGDEYPKPGSQLDPHEEKQNVWIGENGVEMMITDWIADIEQQTGDTICAFIAASHAKFLGPYLPTKQVDYDPEELFERQGIIDRILDRFSDS